MIRLLALICIVSCTFTSLYGDSPAVSEIFLKRHSGKSYNPEMSVSYEQLCAMMEAARWAPSSHNDQPWNFIVCERNLTPEAYAKAFRALKNTQQAWAKNAPLLIIITCRMKETHNGKLNYWGEFDTGAAAICMALQAAELGLMAHQVGGFDKQRIAQEFQLPEDHKPMTIMVIGYELPTDPDPKAFPRQRRPIQETFFLGEWGSGCPADLQIIL